MPGASATTRLALRDRISSTITARESAGDVPKSGQRRSVPASSQLAGAAGSGGVCDAGRIGASRRGAGLATIHGTAGVLPSLERGHNRAGAPPGKIISGGTAADIHEIAV